VKAGRAAILTYHSLDASGSVVSVAPRRFAEQMASLARGGRKVAPVEEVHRVQGAVALTFDDGFANFYEHALPVLAQYGFPATVFVVSGYCGRDNNWPSQPRAGIPRLALMSWSQLKELAACGIRLGAHTVNHPRLPQLKAHEVEEEMRVSQAEIEDRTGETASVFAYPYGATNGPVREAAAKYFRLACSTRMGFVAENSDAFDLPRVDAYYLNQQFWFENLFNAWGSGYVGARKALRSARELLSSS
jgi:peptidoglycan/xylan/chitin deacetylase (PgdA/CDA1 family)